MPRLKALFFINKALKLSYFWKKMQNYQALGATPPDPQLRIFSCAPAALCNVYNYTGVGSFCFEQFFLHRSVANLMMLTVDVCLMLNCFLVEKFYLYYAVCDFDSILLHCTKLFIRQSIDREKNFDVTFETAISWRPSWSTPGKPCQLPLAVRWP